MRVEWTRRARVDLQQIWLFLADFSVDHADRVEKRLEERADALRQFPHLGRPVPGADLRRLSLPDIQYVVDYRIIENRVFIMRVRSTRQDRAEP